MTSHSKQSHNQNPIACFLNQKHYICIMWKEKLGGYLIDVSKYVLTGVVIASFFKDFQDSKPTVYGVGVLFSVLVLIAGLILSNKKKED